MAHLFPHIIPLDLEPVTVLVRLADIVADDSRPAEFDGVSVFVEGMQAADDFWVISAMGE